ncbi:MAG: tRNA guanosine(34) transglycosylase Tgt [Planctomycetes bacterium]|nr:tRNA guanosine(34) transglycosylase Tgt [Planctomycetota bacterium]
MRFETTGNDDNARTGRLELRRAVLETPAFMPVATNGSLKLLTFRAAEDAGFRVLLANAFHLSISAAMDEIAAAGGVNAFTGWDGSFLVDSGGFQVYSLAENRRIDDNGVTFRSPRDGTEMRFTPEEIVRIQTMLQPDIAMVLDECVALPAEKPVLEKAVERTSRWAARSLDAATDAAPPLFGIIQGGLDRALREKSLKEITAMPFAGFAVGGLSVGEAHGDMYEVLDYTAAGMPEDRPRYLMGVGDPVDIVEAAARGIDMFDCVMPTRNARGATAFTFGGKVRMKNACHRGSNQPIEAGCDCYCCKKFTRGYIRHLFAAGEATGAVLLSVHNLRFTARLMEGVREAIRGGTLADFRARIRQAYPESMGNTTNT